MKKIFIKNLNVNIVPGRTVRAENAEHSPDILAERRPYTIPGLLARMGSVNVGDMVKLPAFTVNKKLIVAEKKGGKDLEFQKISVDDYATVYNKTADGALHLVFNHALFCSPVDLNGCMEWEKTQLHHYLDVFFSHAMREAGIPTAECGLLRESEIFGEDALSFFNIGANRIAFDTLEKISHDYWLETPYDPECSQCFCRASSRGYSDYAIASFAGSFVRPRFVVKPL